MAKQQMIQYVNFYTDGSAARKIEPAVAAAKPVLPKQKKQKRKVIRLDPVAFFGIAVSVCMLVMMLVGVSALNEAQAEAQTMQNYVDQLTQKNEQLDQQFAETCDLEEIKTTALALGMIPAEQAQQTSIYVQPPVQPEENPNSIWENLGMVLSNLFA